MLDENRAGPGMINKMPSLLTIAGLQQQMLSKPPLPPLPSQVNKQAMQGKQNTSPASFNLSKSAKRTFFDWNFLSNASFNIFHLIVEQETEVANVIRLGKYFQSN